MRRSAGEEHERLGTGSSGLGGGPLSDASTAVAPLSRAYSDTGVRLSPTRIFYPISRCALALCMNQALPPACHFTSRRSLRPAQRVPHPRSHQAPHARNPLHDRTDSPVTWPRCREPSVSTRQMSPRKPAKPPASRPNDSRDRPPPGPRPLSERQFLEVESRRSSPTLTKFRLDTFCSHHHMLQRGYTAASHLHTPLRARPDLRAYVYPKP